MRSSGKESTYWYVLVCTGIIWNLGNPISSVGNSISNVTFDIEDFDIECSIDIDVLLIRYRLSISKVFDIEGRNTRYRSLKIVDIEGHEQDDRYRSFVFAISNIIIRYRALISYTISKVFFTFDIEYKSFDIERFEYRTRYSIRYIIQPMSFTAERKLPFPRRLHAGAERSQHHEPWIPSPSSCGIPQLDPQRFDEETSFHSATSTC